MNLNYINNISIKHKLIITYFIVVIMPILIIGYFLTNKLYVLSFSNSTEISNATLKQLNGNYTNKLNSYRSVLDGLINYKPLMDYIKTTYSTDYEAIDDFNKKISPFIRRLHNDEGDVQIRIYSNNRSIWHSVEISNTLEDLKRQKWFDYKKALSANTFKWTIAENLEGNPSKKYFGCYKVLRSLDNPSEISSVISVFFDEAQLFSLISKEKEAGKVIFLYNNDNQIITTTERKLLSRNIGDVVFNKSDGISSIRNNSIVEFNNNKYLFFKSIISEKKLLIDDWTLAYLIPANDVLNAIDSIWISSLLLCLVCIIIALILIMLISKNITGRVQTLIGKIKVSIDNDFIIEEGVSGKDEIGILEKDFEEMMHRIRSLIDEVYIADLKIKDSEINYQRIQAEKRKAEIISLQTQINPHYLFNTLETIRMSLVLNDDKKNADIVAAFAESFRQCIDNKRDIYTIREELLFIENYFTIQKYRLRGNIAFKVNVPDYILEYSIPKLILQPLIENAVYHGIEMKGEKGTVEISAREKDGDIRFIVSDDGVGIPEAVLKELIDDLNNQEDNKEKPGWSKIALRNVHTRLRLMYGEEYGLKISSKLNEGTTAEVNFPALP
jgi:sensor histidine kinase YesM